MNSRISTFYVFWIRINNAYNTTVLSPSLQPTTSETFQFVPGQCTCTRVTRSHENWTRSACRELKFLASSPLRICIVTKTSCPTAHCAGHSLVTTSSPAKRDFEETGIKRLLFYKLFFGGFGKKHFEVFLKQRVQLLL